MVDMSSYDDSTDHDPPRRRPARPARPPRPAPAHDEDLGHRGGRRDVAGLARGDARVPVPRASGGARTAACRSTAGRSRAGEAGRRPGRPLVAILLDPSAILAAADAADLNHGAAVAWFERVDEPLLLGALGLGELDLLLQRELGSEATRAVLASVVAGSIRARPADARGPRPRRRCCSARRPSTGRGSPTRCWSRPPSGCRSGASRPSTGGRSRCSGRVTCGRWTSSPRNRNGAGVAGPVGMSRWIGDQPRLTTTVAAWTSWKPWRLELWVTVYSR